MLAFSLHNLDHAIYQWAHGLEWPAEPILRLAIACLLGGLVGLEREIRGRQAGFRTNLLVCLGSALAMVVSTSFTNIAWERQPSVNITVDPARVAYGVMAGIGFLGAGVIVKSNGSVRGLTTAAGLWCISAVGLAVGLGHYLVSTVAAMLILLALWTLDEMERLLPRTSYRLVTLRRTWHPGIVGETVKLVQSYPKVRVVDVSFERSGDLSSIDIQLEIAFSNRSRYIHFERDLDQRADCQIVSSSRT